MKDINLKNLINEMFETQLYEDSILLETHSDDIFPDDPNFIGRNREIIIDKTTKHGGRIKISCINRNTRSGKTISIYIDKEKDGGIICYEGNPKDIKLNKIEIQAYESLCKRNWDLICFIYRNHIDAKTAEAAFEHDEKIRRESGYTAQVIRDRNTGYVYYSTIEYEGFKPVCYKITKDIYNNLISKEKIR